MDLTAKSLELLERFRTSRQTQVLTILLTDIVGSVRAQFELGNLASKELTDRYRELVRGVLRAAEGAEIETAGDSFLLAFAGPSHAVAFAVDLQAALREDESLPSTRIGIHQGQVVVGERGAEGRVAQIYGLQVSIAARVMDCATGGQILMTRSVFDDARFILTSVALHERTIQWVRHGEYGFKGLDDSFELCEVGEESCAPLSPPGASEKAWPTGSQSEEQGWRPGAGGVVPGTNWTLTRRRGQGTVGEVWEAESPGLGTTAVLKFCFERDLVSSLRREARLLSRLAEAAHPNIVRIVDVRADGQPPYYLVLENVAGDDLAAWMSGDHSLQDRLEVIAQVADALTLAHSLGVHHRDVKPQNILVDDRPDGSVRVKLTDFGIGAVRDPAEWGMTERKPGSPAANSWPYVAPEFRSGEGRDHGSPAGDLYALGVTLYQTLRGDSHALLDPDWEKRVGSPVLARDLARLLAPTPALRPEHAALVARDLRHYSTRVAEDALVRVRRSRLRWVRSLTLASLLLVGVTALAIGWALASADAAREARQRERFSGYVFDLLSAAHPNEKGNQLTVLEAVRGAVTDPAALRELETLDVPAAERSSLRELFGHVLYGAQEFGLAAGEFRAAAETASIERRGSLVERAYTAYMDAGRDEEAVRVLRQHPDSGSVFLEMAMAAHNCGDYDVAERHYRAGIESGDDLFRSWLFLARLQLDRGRLTDAESSLEYPKEHRRELQKGLLQLHLAYFAHVAGDWKSAFTGYLEAERLLRSQNLTETASAALFAARGLRDDWTLLTNMPSPLDDLDRPLEFRNAVQLEVIELRNRARILARAGQLARAEEIFQQAIDWEKERQAKRGTTGRVSQAHTYRIWAASLRDAGRDEEAKRQLERALAMVPDVRDPVLGVYRAPVLIQLAEFDERAGDLDSAQARRDEARRIRAAYRIRF